ncbi:MAG: glyoxalase superfamily protein [Tardiphaga sp.]
MDTRFTAITPILRIFDVNKAREFYLDFLGFTLDFEHRFDDNAPWYLQVRLDGITLGLSEHFGGGSPGAHFTVATSGLAAYQAALIAKDYRHARPGLVQQPWGETTMTIADPFYNHIIFSEPTPPA